jgi:ribonuclease P protein component
MPLPSFDCIVRLSRPVNTKTGPATNAALKALLHTELARLFASQAPRARKPAPDHPSVPAPGAPDSSGQQLS